MVVCYTTKSVNHIDRCLSWFQQTPLHAAAWDGDVNKVKTLADAGADTNSKDKNGASETILSVVNWYLFQGIQERLLSTIHAIIRMIQYINPEVGHFLLTLVSFFLHQMTPLHWAAEKGRFNVIKPLVDKGAKINLGDNDRVNEQQEISTIDKFELKIFCSLKVFTSFQPL